MINSYDWKGELIQEAFKAQVSQYSDYQTHILLWPFSAHGSIYSTSISYHCYLFVRRPFKCVSHIWKMISTVAITQRHVSYKCTPPSWSEAWIEQILESKAQWRRNKKNCQGQSRLRKAGYTVLVWVLKLTVAACSDNFLDEGAEKNGSIARDQIPVVYLS